MNMFTVIPPPLLSWCSLRRSPEANLPGHVHHNSHSDPPHADPGTALSQTGPTEETADGGWCQQASALEVPQQQPGRCSPILFGAETKDGERNEVTKLHLLRSRLLMH